MVKNATKHFPINQERADPEGTADGILCWSHCSSTGKVAPYEIPERVFWGGKAPDGICQRQTVKECYIVYHRCGSVRNSDFKVFNSPNSYTHNIKT